MSASTVGGIVGFLQINSDVISIGGAGVDNVFVTLTNLDGSLVIDANGNVVAPVLTQTYAGVFEGGFTFSNIPDGTYAIELPPNGTFASSGLADGRYLVTVTASSDQTNLALDVAGNFVQPTDISAAISGMIYADANDDGQRDNGETAAGGQRIELANAGGTVVDVTTAAANGAYRFSGLTPGDYTLATPGIGMSQAPGTIALTSGETVANAVIGVYQLGISGVAFNDVNGDGVQDGSDGAFAGQTIELFNSAGALAASATTNSDGDFSLVGLTPGTYNFGAAGGGVGAATGGQTITIGTASVSNITLAAFDAATISGLIFLDENDDGIFEVTPQGTDPDLGTGGVTVGFLNAQGSLAGTATSGFGGLFTSTPLAPGFYTLEDLSGPGILSGGPAFHMVSVTAGETFTTQDIGFYEPNSIVVPSIFIDTNFDGSDDSPLDYLTASSAEPVTVALLNQDGSIARDLNGNLQIQTFTSGVLQDTSQQFGPFTVDVPAVTFGNLAPGYYAVEVTAPGYASENSVYQTGASLETAGLPEQSATAVQSVALYKVGTGLTITGAVYAGNGSSEQGVAGDTVTLLQNNNGTLTVEQSVEVGANGQYMFSGLGAGQNYEIDFGTPLGYSAITPIHDVPVADTGTAGIVQGPLAFFTASAAPGTVAASSMLNIVLIGQSNAAFFTQNGYLTSLENDIEKDLGFNGTTQLVNIIAAGGPPDSGSTNISSAPATEFGGTGLTTDWLTANNGNPADGWSSGTNEDGVYSQMNAILTYLAQTVASNPALSSEPTVILDLHNETDSQNPALNTSLWMSALNFEASAIRGVLGQSAAETPYAFVNAIPFPEEPIAVATQAQVDSNEQAIRLGMESLASDPAFNAIIAAQISDVDQNYQAAGDGGWHLNGGSSVNGAGQTVGVEINPATGTAYDQYNLEQRLALSLADEFAASAQPGSPIANTLSATGTLFDDTGPLVTGAATVAGSPDELLVTVQQFDSLTSFNTSLSADAQAGVGWSIRSSASGPSSQLVATATSASIISSNEILLTFDTAVPAAATGAELFYAWGGERIALPATPSSPLNTDYTGTTYPGEGQAIYDSNGLPIYTNAAGVLVGSSQETVASYLSVALGQTIANPLIRGGTLELGVSAAVTGDIIFTAGTGGELIIDGAAPANLITGFTAGDTIELAGIPFVAGADSYAVATAGTLSIDANGTLFTLDLAGVTVGQTNLVLSADLAITETAECFLAGTRIATPGGDVAVERLTVGDEILTQDGDAARILWIGKRAYAARFAARNHLVRPVCIQRDAIAPGVPARDLHVSPGHGIFVDGVLVPAWRLINGVSITQAALVAADIHYYHIELVAHAVILAENCPAESYLDIGSRSRFQNAGSAPQRPAAAPLPRVDFGAPLQAIRRRLNARAGLGALSDDTAQPVTGYIDQMSPGLVSGWAYCPSNPAMAVALDIYFWSAGKPAARRVIADLYRADVRYAGIGTGCYGFECALPADATNVRVMRGADVSPLTCAERVCAAAG